MRLATAAMGTRFEIVVAGRDPDRFRPAAEAALEAIESCHRRFSRFAEDSLVAHLARVPAGTAVGVDPETLRLLEEAVLVWRGSEGAFDVTGTARAMEAIRLDPLRRSVSLARDGLLLDLGAIAKGHAIDLAADCLREGGVTSAFLHGGTSSATGIGAPPGGAGWSVALSDAPDAEVVTLRDEALAVSRTAHETPHPTLDPRTGRPVRAARQAAVIGPRASLCDAWATAAVVLGSRPHAMPVAYELRLLLTALPPYRLTA